MRLMRDADVDFDEPYDWEIREALLNPRRKVELKPIATSTLNKRRQAFFDFYGKLPGGDLSQLRSAFDPPHNWLAGKERFSSKRKTIVPKIFKKMNPIAAINRKRREYWL